MDTFQLVSFPVVSSSIEEDIQNTNQSVYQFTLWTMGLSALNFEYIREEQKEKRTENKRENTKFMYIVYMLSSVDRKSGNLHMLQ